MYNRINLCIFILLITLPGSVIGRKMANTTLDMSVTCRENEKCIFTGKEIFLDINLTNISGVNVMLPLEYLQKKGPIVKLIDAYTQSESYLKVNLADPDFRKNFVVISPEQTVTMEWVIFSDELKQYEPYVNVVAEISIQTDMKVNGEIIKYVGTNKIKIVSIKTVRQVLITPD